MGIFSRDKNLNKPFEDLSKEASDSKVLTNLTTALNPLINLAWNEKDKGKDDSKGVAYCRTLWTTEVKNNLNTEELFLNALKLAKAGENANKGWFSRLNGKSLQSTASRVFIALLKTQSGMVNIIKKDETHKLSDILAGVNITVDKKNVLSNNIATNEKNKISKNFLDYVKSKQPSNFNSIAEIFSDTELNKENKKKDPKAFNEQKKKEQANEQSVQAKLENQKKENEKEKKEMEEFNKKQADNKEKATIAYALMYQEFDKQKNNKKAKTWPAGWNKKLDALDKKLNWRGKLKTSDIEKNYQKILDNAQQTGKELLTTVEKMLKNL